MSQFFIGRPVFAWVLAIVTIIAGLLSLNTLPVAQYPSIAPPAVSITVTYPGASAETVQSTVVQVIEQQLSGIDHLLYIDSESDKDGSMDITLSFDQGTNPDIAQVQVQNKLQLAEPRLPQEVQQQGIRVAKATKNFLMVAGFVSTDGRMTSGDVADMIASKIQDPLSRTEGVGDYQLFGTEYAMRIWLDPAKLNSYSLTTSDVASAISSQNVQVAAGELGGLPAVGGQQLNATIIGPTYLNTPEQFSNILVKVLSSGARIHLRDIARIEMGPEQYSVNTEYNGKPAAGIAIKLASGANALNTVAAVKQTIDELRPQLPRGIDVVYPYDTSPFVRLSIHDVVETLFEAIGLVFVIMFIFLQNFRATLIPTIAVPVVLLGTCAVLGVAGYSINTLTMFGMVLAIGLLVDDAIVVVENVERLMEEDESLTPKQAARRSMGQITGALVGIATVLSAVFLPMAFFGGSVGVIYRQFSVTIVASMVLSVITAMVFTPALCATILKRKKKGAGERGFFGWFNRSFDRTNRAYGGWVSRMIARPLLPMVMYVVLIAVMAFAFLRIPGGFLPDEDQGVMFVQVTEPPGATGNRTQAVLDDVTHYLLDKEGDYVKSVFAVNGFGFVGRGQTAGIAFVSLKDFDKRGSGRGSAQAIAGRAMQHFGAIRDAQVFAFIPPAVLELGNATGFDFELRDIGGVGHEALVAARNQLLGMAAKDPKLSQVRPNDLDDEPQFKVDIDREKAAAYGITLSDINTILGSAWGSSYVNDFLAEGRIKRVYLQGEAATRMQPDDFAKWYVRNNAAATAASGATVGSLEQMVPLSAFMTGNWIYGAPKLQRYNGLPAIELLGAPAEGESSGTAMKEMETLAGKLPDGIGYQWTGMSYEEQKAGSQTTLLYSLSLIVVFLCLAALYESWSIPTAVLLVVPLGILGVALATLFRGLSNDVYFQVGLLTTIGLAAKNAILIVEFAKENYDEGMSLVDSALHAAEQRLRPILMTSLAFILGVLPLAISTGAGAGSQNAIGTAVVGGMLAATVLAIFFVPLFFVLVLKLFKVPPGRPGVDEEPAR
ncbi:multidrug efflux pump [Endobacter medicaginis]|uniref:Efflux pump membrane transporter n=1 Tax=Endobacter medicaginis TaxID=1181271 RepID=A0A839UYU2_9PROT|nr:efflux RND transporter permease subunit [Endobacter medicaginis]MBB3172459.1 multidrug efflux pump [Endobacter medicaginis]MCX5474052.1 efflux RND transporter permease subunit [Endobacter medicaginis]NVN30047.1 efflux RND transporter permease subunit [Endobacter medicaginis]